MSMPSAADLTTARQHAAGSIYMLHRVTFAGRDTCTGKCETRAGCDCSAPAGSAEPLGDDCAERHSGWGLMPECAPEGGKHRAPSSTAKPGLWARICRRLLGR